MTRMTGRAGAVIVDLLEKFELKGMKHENEQRQFVVVVVLSTCHKSVSIQTPVISMVIMLMMMKKKINAPELNDAAGKFRLMVIHAHTNIHTHTHTIRRCIIRIHDCCVYLGKSTFFDYMFGWRQF
jgi:hypothetical protein